MSVGTNTGQPPWQRLSGVKRIASEFKYLCRCADEQKFGQIKNLTTVDDNTSIWRFELNNFDESVPAGQQLNSDLKQLKLRHGQGFLLMEVTFPEAYPHEPLFLRVVSPRCVWYTGHVTAGGAVCLEVLTNTGSSNGWRPGFCVESILQIAILNMLHTESVTVRTASGPGGRSGPLRLDLQKRHCSDVMQPYSMAEAKSAFARLLRHHQANGWDPSPASQPVLDHGRLARSRPFMHRSSMFGDAVASPSLGTSQQLSAGDKDRAVMHRDCQSNRLAEASTAQACPSASHQEKPADKHRWSASHTAGPDVLPLGPSSSVPLLRPAACQQPAATNTQADAEAEAVCLDNSNERHITWQSAVDLTDIPVNAASSQQQLGTKAPAGAVAPDQPDAAGPIEEMHEAATDSHGPSDMLLEAVVVDLVSPAGLQHAHAKHPGNDLSSGIEAKRRRLSSEACQQVGLAEQRAQEHAELAVKLEGIHQERMTLGGPSSMFSDNLIDLTDNVEDALGAAPTQGVLADAAIPGQKLAEAVVPAAAVMSFTSAATAAPPPAPALASSAPAAASAAASAEAARVKELEAELAEFQSQSTLLQAQNMRLESELEKAQQLSQAGSRMASLVQPPCHWQAHAQGQTLLYVELPIFDEAKQGAMKPSDAELKAQHKGWFSDMRTNAVDMNDALIALRKHSGNEEAALQLLLEYSEQRDGCTLGNGGIANYVEVLDSIQTPSSPLKPVADACDRELETEAEMVMQLWEDHGGLSRHQITSIRRVQNMPLWTKYALTRAEIQEARPELTNAGETWLFHGAHRTCVEAIAAKGFDIRVSNRGMLGQGTYFANCSAYSDKYARNGPDRAAGLLAVLPGGPHAPHRSHIGARLAQRLQVLANQHAQQGLQHPSQQQALLHQGPNQGQQPSAGYQHPQASQQHALPHQSAGLLPRTAPVHALSASNQALPPWWSDPFASASAAAAAAAGSSVYHAAAYISSMAGSGAVASSANPQGPSADPGVIRTREAHLYGRSPARTADRSGQRSSGAASGSSTHGQAVGSMDPDAARGGHDKPASDRHDASSASPVNRPFTRHARNSATNAAVNKSDSGGDAHAQVVRQLLASRNRSKAELTSDVAAAGGQAAPSSYGESAALACTESLAAGLKIDATASPTPAESGLHFPMQSLRRRDQFMEEHRQELRPRGRGRTQPEELSPKADRTNASAEAIVEAATAQSASFTPAVGVTQHHASSSTFPLSHSCPQTSAGAPKAQGRSQDNFMGSQGTQDPPSGSQGGSQAFPFSFHGGIQNSPSRPHGDVPSGSQAATQDPLSGSQGVTQGGPLGSAAAMPPPAPRQPAETSADPADLLWSPSLHTRRMHSFGAGLLDFPDPGEYRPKKQRVHNPNGSEFTQSCGQAFQQAVAKEPADRLFPDLNAWGLSSNADKAPSLPGDCPAKQKQPPDSTMDASDQQDLPAWLSSHPWLSVTARNQADRGAAADYAGHGRQVADTSEDKLGDSHRAAPAGMTEAAGQSYSCTDKRNAGAQRGDVSAATDDRVAARPQHVKAHTAPLAVSDIASAAPDAEPDQLNPMEGDKQPTVKAATAAEGHQQHQYMPASSALAQEPNQAPPANPAAPVATSSRKSDAEAWPSIRAGRSASGGQQGSGLPQGIQQGSQLPQGSQQGPGEGSRPAKKLNQARSQDKEQGPLHAYRLRNRAPSTEPVGQETAQGGLQRFDIGDAPVEHVRQNWVSNRGTEPRQDKEPHGSVEGDNGKETWASKGKGKGKADRHSRGKGEVVQQGAASDGPAGAVVLGSALDTVANEVTSRAGPQLPMPSPQAPQPATFHVPQPARLQPVAPSSTAAMLQQSPDETGRDGLTILLSRVALGTLTRGSSDLRRPPEGYDSTTHLQFMGKGRSADSKMDIYCVYDNAQAYPDYIITYKATRARGVS